MDALGHHIQKCAKGGMLIMRHNRIRDLFHDMFVSAKLQAQMEVPGFYLNSRPGRGRQQAAGSRGVSFRGPRQGPGAAHPADGRLGHVSCEPGYCAALCEHRGPCGQAGGGGQDKHTKAFATIELIQFTMGNM